MNSSDNRPGKPVEQRARELWHEAARHIDPATAERLRAARRQALRSTPASQPSHRPLADPHRCLRRDRAGQRSWCGNRRTHPPQPAQASSASDAGAELDNELPPDADKTDPNLYQNLDFYGWLAASDSRPATR